VVSGHTVPSPGEGKETCMLWTVLLVILIVVLLGGGFPGWGPWHAQYGYAPISIGGILLVILVVLLLTGRL
jgi:hypothetical protein